MFKVTLAFPSMNMEEYISIYPSQWGNFYVTGKLREMTSTAGTQKIIWSNGCVEGAKPLFDLALSV